MKRRSSVLFLGIGLLLTAMPAFAQAGPGGGGVPLQGWVVITSGFAMAIASAVCGLAQARATAAAAEGMARNPAATAAIRFALILGLALIESLVIYVLVVCLILLIVNPFGI